MEIKQDILIKLAKKFLGKPYKYGAKPEEAPIAFDCSSFVQYIYKEIKIGLPRTAIEQASCGKKVKSVKKLEPGDLIFIKGIVGRYNQEFPQGVGHVAIYMGDNKIIQARYKKNQDGSDGGSVEISKADKILSRKDLTVIKRII